jgi:exonuclease SbcC
LRAARDAASAEHAEAARRLEAAQRKAVGLRERGAGPSLDAARRAEDAARIRRGEVAALATIAAAARERVAARGVIADELAVVDAAVGADRAAIAVATAARDAARGAVAELDHSVATLRTIAGYGHARTELIDGEPCPLCGAVEHPWRDRGAMDAAIRDAEHRLAAARGRDAAATGELAAIAARDAHHRAERARLVARAAALDAARAGQLAAWRDQLAALAELALVDDPDAPAAAGFAAERMVAADAACEAARAERARVEAGLKAAADAHQESLARQADVGHVVARLASIDDDRRALAAVVERHAGERAARLAHAAELAAQIAAELAPWRDVVADAEPAAAIATLVAAWRRAADRIATADAELAAADAALVRAVAAAERAVAEADARATAARARRDVVIGEHAGAAAALAAATAEAGLDPAALHRLLAAPAGHADALAARLDALARADALAVAVAAERARDVAAHAASCPADLALVAQVGALDRAAADADALVARLVAELAADDDARTRRAAALVALADATAGYEVDRVLGEVIGSHDGKLFRSFAQSLTLDSLLAVANAHLDELAPRYRLERVPRHDLELQVVDRELGGELRSVQSLSGGESFLVSLALALGLSAMSAHDVRVRTLLIDEGFGTLDPATLDTALAVLDRLQATGRQIGVISHVPALVERVGAHVRVIQRGNGRSEVVVAG